MATSHALVGTQPAPLHDQSSLVVAIAAGIAATAMFNLAPVYLAAAVAAQHVSARQSGVLLSMEIAGIALASGVVLLAGHRWTPRGMIRAGGAVIVIGNLLSLAVSDLGSLLALRLLTGLAGDGWVYAAALRLLGRQPDPVRAFALFSFSSMCVTATGLLVLPLVSAAWSWPTILMLFAAFGGVASVMSHRLARPIEPQRRSLSFSVGIGWLGLVAIFAYTLNLGAVWAYASPLGRDFGIGEQAIGRVLAASIAAQAAGSLTAARFGRVIDARHGLLLIVLLQAGGLDLLSTCDQIIGFAAGLCLWGFGWNFGIALILGLLAKQAHSDRLLALVPGTEALGAATGPALVAVVVGLPLSSTVSGIGFAALLVAVAAATGLMSDGPEAPGTMQSAHHE